MKFEEMDTYYGNIMKYKNGEHIIYKENVLLSYDHECDWYVWIDNDLLDLYDYFNPYYKNKDKLDEKIEETSDHYLTDIPKEEEGYMYIDSSSLKMLGDSLKKK